MVHYQNNLILLAGAFILILQHNNYQMETKMLLPKELYEMEAIKYVASRYGTTPENVLRHYFEQIGILPANNSVRDTYTLEPNELALFHDLGVQSCLLDKFNI